MAAVVAIVLVWLLVWRGDAPPPPSVLERSEALTATTEPAAAAAEEPAASESPEPTAETAPPAEPPSPAPATPEPPPTPPAAPESSSEPESPSPPPGEPVPPPEPEPSAETPAEVEPTEPAAANLDGVWSVNTTLGSFDDYTSSWAGYRGGRGALGDRRDRRRGADTGCVRKRGDRGDDRGGGCRGGRPHHGGERPAPAGRSRAGVRWTPSSSRRPASSWPSR